MADFETDKTDTIKQSQFEAKSYKNLNKSLTQRLEENRLLIDTLNNQVSIYQTQLQSLQT